MSGNLPRTGTAVVTSDHLVVYDTSGNKQTLKVNFNPADEPAADPRSGRADSSAMELTWKIATVDENDQVVGSGNLLFNADGTPAASNTVITATVTARQAAEFTFTLNFGEAGTFSGVTSLLATTTTPVSVLKQDGHDIGTIGAMLFDERGNLEITYSNQEKLKIGRLVLARVSTRAVT